MQNQKKKSKKRKTENLTKVNNNEEDGHSLIIDDDLVVTQILSRLPVKSLMRCKCVCKNWKSIIGHDSKFTHLHHTLSGSQLCPGLFIAARPRRLPSYRRVKRWRRGFESSFYYADLHFDDDGGSIGGATIHRVTRGFKSPDEVVKYLGPVKGLLCLVDIFSAVQIYNVTTGQATPWIKSAVVMSRKHEGLPRCQFGFDPNTGQHKVLFIWHVTHESRETGYKERYTEAPVCEVLTVGDTRWRIIDDVPPCEMKLDFNVHANGSIYWHIPRSSKSKLAESLVAFDIGSEKFRKIPIPDFTLWEGKYRFPFLGLTEMDGCPTVMRTKRSHSHEVKLWKFYDYGKENGTSSTISASRDQKEVWTEVDIMLPVSVQYCEIYFHPISGKNQMILEMYDRGYCPWNAKTALFYSYDLIKKTCNKFEVQGISDIPKDCQTYCGTLVESLLPVR